MKRIIAFEYLANRIVQAARFNSMDIAVHARSLDTPPNARFLNCKTKNGMLFRLNVCVRSTTTTFLDLIRYNINRLLQFQPSEREPFVSIDALSSQLACKTLSLQNHRPINIIIASSI